MSSTDQSGPLPPKAAVVRSSGDQWLWDSLLEISMNLMLATVAAPGELKSRVRDARRELEAVSNYIDSGGGYSDRPGR